MYAFFCLWRESGKCQRYLMYPELCPQVWGRNLATWNLVAASFQGLLLRHYSCSILLFFQAWKPYKPKAPFHGHYVDRLLQWYPVLVSRCQSGAVSFRKVMPYTWHSKIDPTPVPRFMLFADEKLKITDINGADFCQTSPMRCFSFNIRSHLTSRSQLHLQQPVWTNFTSSGEKLGFSETYFIALFELEVTLKGHLVQLVCNEHRYLQLEQVAQSLIQHNVKCLHWWVFHHLSGQLVPVSRYPYCKKFLPYVKSKSSLL